jgi:cell division septation protein DedD
MKEKKSDSRYEFKLNFKEITLFLVGSIGVITLFFIIGIWIGKSLNTVPTEIINKEYVTAEDFPEGDEDFQEEKVIDVPKSDDDTSFEFQESLKEEEIIPLKEEKKPKKKKEVTSADKKTIKAKSELDNFTVPKKEASSVAIAKANEKKIEAAKNTKKGKYTVQIASLKSDKSALKLVGRLEKKGYSAYFIATNLKDKGVWYRVRVGNFKTRKDAEKIVKNVEDTIKIKGMIVKDSRYY